LKRSYHTITTRGATNARRLAEFFSRNGQGLLPMASAFSNSIFSTDLKIQLSFNIAADHISHQRQLLRNL
jgi:hypothetical protein